MSPSPSATPSNASQIPSHHQLQKTTSFGHFAPCAEHLPPLCFSACPTSQLVLRVLRTKRERPKRMLTSFIDKDCQESRLQMKGLSLAGGKGGEAEMPEAAGACAGCRVPALAGCSAFQLLRLHFFACLVGRMEQCLQLSSSALDRNLSFHLLPMSSFITELGGLGVLFVLVVYSHRKPLKSLLKRRALDVTDKETCQSKQDPAQPRSPPMGSLPGAGGAGGLALVFCPFQWDELPNSFFTFYRFLTILVFVASQRPRACQRHKRVGAQHG